MRSKEKPRPDQKPAPAAPLAGKRVVLAEDDPDTHRILARVLRQDGCEVTDAYDGAELLDCIEGLEPGSSRNGAGAPDLVVSDIRLPWISGLEALRELRRRDRQIPVVLITAFGDEATHLQAYRLGAVAVFDKPFDMREFRSFIRQTLSPSPSDICDLLV